MARYLMQEPETGRTRNQQRGDGVAGRQGFEVPDSMSATERQRRVLMRRASGEATAFSGTPGSRAGTATQSVPYDALQHNRPPILEAAHNNDNNDNGNRRARRRARREVAA